MMEEMCVYIYSSNALTVLIYNTVINASSDSAFVVDI